MHTDATSWGLSGVFWFARIIATVGLTEICSILGALVAQGLSVAGSRRLEFA